MSKLNREIIKGFFWSSSGQTGYIIISLLANIILVRFLTPEEFGQMGIIAFFSALANVFVVGGFGGAVIRLADVKQKDYETVFTFNLLISIFCYFLLFFLAPSVASFFEDAKLSKLLRVSSLVLFVNALLLVNNAILVREMRFKQKSMYSFLAILIASIIAIVSALNGLGVWSLVLLQILTQTLILVQLSIFEGLFLKIGWDKHSFSLLFSFGVNTTAANLLNTAFINIYSLIIGKFFSITQVGYFYQAQKLEKVPQKILNAFTQNVLFSGLSKVQGDKKLFASTYNRIVNILTVIMATITLITFVYGEQLIRILFGNEWVGSVIYLQLLILAGFFYMQEQFNRVIFKVYNQAKQIFYLELVKKAIQSLTIVIGIIYQDLIVLVSGLIITNILSSSINYYYSRKIVSDFSEVIIVLKILFTSIITGFFVIKLISILQLNDWMVFLTLPVLLLIKLFLMQFFKIIDVKELYLVLNRHLKRE